MDNGPIANAVGPAPFCVCIPARNEEVRLPAFLDALAAQDVGRIVPVAIGLNNTRDGSLAVIEAARRQWRGRLSIQVDTVTFEPTLAHAGSARRHAMAIGAQSLGQAGEGILISTDADTRPPPEWVRANLEALSRGVDLVGGRLVIDEREPLSASMTEGRRLWDVYWAQVRAIEDAIDPVAWDPAPRHGDHTGASLALRVSTWREAGGVPLVPHGEDRALVTAALASGARLGHPMSVWTRVSPRTEGRANGGMASHLVAMSGNLDAGRPIMAPSLDQWRARAEWRRARRASYGVSLSLVEAEARLPAMVADLRLSDLMATA